MHKYSVLLGFLFLFSLAFSFSIDSYQADAAVQTNGDLLVTEEMVFTLEQEYSEGYRSIRPSDYGKLSNIIVHSVTVNGQPVPYSVSQNGEFAEIIWEKTYVGENKVVLEYTLKDRVEVWDDFARICFEHYGANWPAPAKTFQSTMALPEASRGRVMHYEIYSYAKPQVHIEDLSIVVDMQSVPPGNYIGGCYLFDKTSVNTTNRVSGRALDILTEERESYGSESLMSPEDDFPLGPCCLPIFAFLLIIVGILYLKRPKAEKLGETLIPPYEEAPIVVSTLMKGTYQEKEILAATILELINKGVIDIMELEKKGYSGQEIKRERTILFLKKSSKKLAPHEQTVVDLIFENGKKKEVDLDAFAKDLKKIHKKTDAKKTSVPQMMDEFTKQIKEVLKQKKLYKTSQARKKKIQLVSTVAMFAFLIGVFFGIPFVFGAVDLLGYLFSIGDYLYAGAIIFSMIGSIVALGAIYFLYLQPTIPKGWEKKYSQWDAFSNAVKASSLKEEPPAAALIWGQILVYATALGLADKVGQHLSELDTILAQRVRKLEKVRDSSYVFYTSAWGVRNLSHYGQRSGPKSGGFSGGSSGGWSSGGGGGFSGGSSGGGGFR